MTCSTTPATNRVLLTLKVHILSPQTTHTSPPNTSIYAGILPAWQSFVFPSYGALAVSIATSAKTQNQPSAYPTLQHGLLQTDNTKIEGVLFEGDNEWHWQQLSRMCKELGKCSDASKCYHVFENGALLELDASMWGEMLAGQVCSGRIANLEQSIIVAESMTQAQHLLKLQQSSALCDHLTNFVEDLDEAVIRLGRRTGKRVTSSRDTLNVELVKQVARSESWEETILKVFDTLAKPYIEMQMSKTYSSSSSSNHKKSLAKDRKQFNNDKDIEMQMSRVEIDSPRTADKMLPAHSTSARKSMAIFDDQVISSTSPILGKGNASMLTGSMHRQTVPQHSTPRNEQSMFINGSRHATNAKNTRIKQEYAEGQPQATKKSDGGKADPSQDGEQDWIEA